MPTTVKEILLLHFLERVCPASSSPACHHTTPSASMSQGKSAPHQQLRCVPHGMFLQEALDQRVEKEVISRVSEQPSPCCSGEALLGTLGVPKSENHKKHRLPLSTGRAPAAPSRAATSWSPCPAPTAAPAPIVTTHSTLHKHPMLQEPLPLAWAPQRQELGDPNPLACT